MTELPDFSKMTGWDKEQLPPTAQGLIVSMHFQNAVEVMTANLVRLRDEMHAMLDGAQPDEIMERLSAIPMFRLTMTHLAETAEQEDGLFRLNAQQLYERVRGENTTSLLSLCAAIWVTEGCKLNEELLDLSRAADEAYDEELEEEE